MTEDGFLIIETYLRPKPDAEPKPVIVNEPGRTFSDLSPAQKSRTVRLKIGPCFIEPTFTNNGPTGRWRVGREFGSEERTIAEFGSRTDAIECFRIQVAEFQGSG